jgi:RNA polymerase sigma factor (sigma-70 family)
MFPYNHFHRFIYQKLMPAAPHIEEVIKGCIKGNPKYQQILYNTFIGFALKTVFRYISQYDKATDVINDGFVRLFTHFARFTGADTPEETRRRLFGYIRRIMVNAAIDELRKSSMLPEIVSIPESVWETSHREYDADQLLLYKQVITKIKELPPQYRLAFNMYVIDGFSHAEIARMLNIPEGTSKSNLSRARAMLQKSIVRAEEIKLCTI